MKVYVIRHGQTDGNITDVLQGHRDTELNDTGRNQAKDVKKILGDTKIDLIIASPMKRTKETADIINDSRYLIIYDDRLKSRNHGEFEGMTINDIDFNQYWNYNDNVKYEKAENVRDLYNRVSSFMDEIKEKYKGKDILLVTHSGVCRTLYFYFNGIPEDGNFRRYKSNTCSFEEYELED